MSKPNYKQHEWGVSMRLTPDGCPEEVVIACVNRPKVFSSVHLHEWKDNRIICNNGEVLVDIFPFELAIDDVIHGSILYSDYHSIILKPGEDILISQNMLHRICGLVEGTFFTEIYRWDAQEHDICRVIPAGQKWNGVLDTIPKDIW